VNVFLFYLTQDHLRIVYKLLLGKLKQWLVPANSLVDQLTFYTGYYFDLMKDTTVSDLDHFFYGSGS